MGYTNYWKTKELKNEEISKQFWDDAEKILDIIIGKGIVLADGMGEQEFESGREILDAATKSESKYPSIILNGLGEHGYETFALCFDGRWDFCKTGEEPYDLAVKCLLMLADKYGYLDKDKENGPTWEFDGRPENDLWHHEASALMISLQLI